jgi:AraC-like DNA-binding protein
VPEPPPFVLRPPQGGRPFEVDRRPAGGLPGCSHLWSVRHALPRGTEYVQEVLSLPAVNFTVEWTGDGCATWVYGPVTGRFTRTLVGTALTLAVQFLPGGFVSPTGVAAADLVDGRLPAAAVLGPWADGRWESLETFGAALRAALPAPSPAGELVTRAARLAEADSDLTRVAELADRVGVTARTLQRRFERHLGVGPKWVLRRARIADLLATIEACGEVDLAAAAARLGFTDQAHLTNAFTGLVGLAPGAYRRRVLAAG